MTLLFVLLVILSLVAAFFNKVCGVDFEVSVWISMAIMAGAFVAFICWCFFFHRAKVIERAQNIAKIRRVRIGDEYNREWEERNKKFCRQRDREIDQEVERKFSLLHRDEDSNDTAPNYHVVAYWPEGHHHHDGSSDTG